MKVHKLLRILIITINLVVLSIQSHAQITEPVSAKNGIVVCSERYASEIGLKILKEGGNAIDAAIAMSFALAVTYPTAGNIGGGGFILFYRNDGMIISIDFREMLLLILIPVYFLMNKAI